MCALLSKSKILIQQRDSGHCTLNVSTNFFVANDIEDTNRQRAILQTVVGTNTYPLLSNLLSLAAPTTKTLAEIIFVLNSHFEPALSKIVDRYKLDCRVRRAD